MYAIRRGTNSTVWSYFQAHRLKKYYSEVSTSLKWQLCQVLLERSFFEMGGFLI